jgi:hypothetical protein
MRNTWHRPTATSRPISGSLTWGLFRRMPNRGCAFLSARGALPIASYRPAGPLCNEKMQTPASVAAKVAKAMSKVLAPEKQPG